VSVLSILLCLWTPQFEPEEAEGLWQERAGRRHTPGAIHTLGRSGAQAPATETWVPTPVTWLRACLTSDCFLSCFDLQWPHL
jgi:hypothetical protein